MYAGLECSSPQRISPPFTEALVGFNCEMRQPAQKLILKNPLSPGDVLVSTAALESLHGQYPGQFVTDVDTAVPAVFENNPRVTPLGREDPEVRVLPLEYPLIQACNQRPVHFLQGYTECLAAHLGIKLELTTNRPHLYLSADEMRWMSQVQEITGRPTKFWVINAGTKQDYTTKGWGHANYQTVVNTLRGRVLFVQVGELQHLHRPLAGVINLLGKTDIRQLIRLCWNAQGGVGPTTFIQHIFAAFQKPYVCLLGGREPVSWTHYPTQTTLSTHGTLECCRLSACWRSRTVPLEDGAENDRNLCESPVLGEDPIPRCMALIAPERVVQAIEAYYVGGLLSY